MKRILALSMIIIMVTATALALCSCADGSDEDVNTGEYAGVYIKPGVRCVSGKTIEFWITVEDAGN